MNMKPLLLDLCCGKGGWARGFLAAGWRVIGVDLHEQPLYPGEFVQFDVCALARHLAARPDSAAQWGQRIDLIVASPPCEEFSRLDMPWTRRLNHPAPDLSIVAACRQCAAFIGAPLILENVRGAQPYIGTARWHAGPFYLWGDVPAIMPRPDYRHKSTRSSEARLDRAMVPENVARHLAECFRPV